MDSNPEMDPNLAESAHLGNAASSTAVPGPRSSPRESDQLEMSITLPVLDNDEAPSVAPAEPSGSGVENEAGGSALPAAGGPSRSPSEKPPMVGMESEGEAGGGGPPDGDSPVSNSNIGSGDGADPIDELSLPALLAPSDSWAGVEPLRVAAPGERPLIEEGSEPGERLEPKGATALEAPGSALGPPAEGGMGLEGAPGAEESEPHEEGGLGSQPDGGDTSRDVGGAEFQGLGTSGREKSVPALLPEEVVRVNGGVLIGDELRKSKDHGERTLEHHASEIFAVGGPAELVSEEEGGED